ncbi:MAG: flagellar FliJ family protein [Dehalococcoidia bacterium]
MPKAFRLHRVLEHRQLRERQQQGVVALAREALAGAERPLADMLARQRRERSRPDARQLGAVDVDGATRAQRYREYLEGAIATQRERVAECESDLRAEEAVMVERRRNRRALEKLEARHEFRQREQARRQDAALTDEVVMGRAARQAAE